MPFEIIPGCCRMACIKTEPDPRLTSKTVGDYSDIRERASYGVLLVCSVFQKNHRVARSVVQGLANCGNDFFLSFFVPFSPVVPKVGDKVGNLELAAPIQFVCQCCYRLLIDLRFFRRWVWEIGHVVHHRADAGCGKGFDERVC